MTVIPSPGDHRPLIVVPWLEGGGAQSALVELLRRVAEPRPDLIVLFSGNANFEPVLALVNEHVFYDESRGPAGAWRAARRLRKQLLGRTRIFSVLRASTVVVGLLPASLLRRLELAASFHQLPSLDAASRTSCVETVLIRRALKHATLVTTPSERAAVEIIQFRLAPIHTVEVEHNFVVQRSSGPVQPRKGPLSEVRLVAIGRLSHQKGLDLLPSLLERAEVPVHLRILGDGPLRKQLEGQLSNSEAMNVEFLGHTSDVERHLDWCDALVMPSRWELNPLAVWEAWDAGRPVIATDLPVFQDLARQGPLSTYRNAFELADHVRELAVGITRRRAFETTRQRAIPRADGSSLVAFLQPPDGST